jgi:hypothetical protein
MRRRLLLVIASVNPVLGGCETAIRLCGGCRRRYIWSSHKVQAVHALGDGDIDRRKEWRLGLRGMDLRDRSGSGFTPTRSVYITPVTKKLVGSLHRHTTEVGDEVCTVSMACNFALGAPASILASEGEDVTTVTAPVRTQVGDGFEAMRNTMVDLLFVVISSI